MTGRDRTGGAATGHVAAVIPVLDEEGAIGPTVARIPRDIVAQVLVVDGGSRDNTVAEARAAHADVLVESRRGYGRACLTGAEHAAATGAGIIVFLDGDGSDAPEVVSRLIDPILANQADFVLAARTAAGRTPGSMGWHQIAAGHAIGAAVGILAGHRYSDMCAFRAIRTDALLALQMREMTYGWNLEMQMRAARARLRIREVAVPYGRRVAGRSKVAGSVRGTLRAGTRIIGTLLRIGLERPAAAP